MKKILFLLSFVLSSAAVHAAVPAEVDTLLRTKNCLACHAYEKKLVGPSFADVKINVAKRGTTAEALATKVMKGGSGVYGPIPMPANPQINAQDALTITKWLTAKE